MNFFGASSFHHQSKKVVFITGCDEGIGRATAIELHSLGYVVIAGCLTDNGVSSLNEEKPGVRAEKCDVTVEEDIVRIASMVKTEYRGRLHCLVNNAGVVVSSHVLIAPLESAIETVSVNLLGTMRVTKIMLPLLVDNEGSRIVFLSSVCGLCPLWGGSSYSASKFGIEGFARVLRDELGGFGVSVSIMNPSTTDTGMSRGYAHSLKMRFQEAPDDVKSLFGHDYGDRCFEHYSPRIKQVSCSVRVPVSSICHAVGSRKPKARYYCGFAAKTLFRLAYVFPGFCSFLNRSTAVRPRPSVNSEAVSSSLLDLN